MSSFIYLFVFSNSLINNKVIISISAEDRINVLRILWLLSASTENDRHRIDLLVHQICCTRLPPELIFHDIFWDQVFHELSNAVRRLGSDWELEEESSQNVGDCWYNGKRVDGRQICENLLKTLKSFHPPPNRTIDDDEEEDIDEKPLRSSYLMLLLNFINVTNLYS